MFLLLLLLFLKSLNQAMVSMRCDGKYISIYRIYIASEIAKRRHIDDIDLLKITWFHGCFACHGCWHYFYGAPADYLDQSTHIVLTLLRLGF